MMTQWIAEAASPPCEYGQHATCSKCMESISKGSWCMPLAASDLLLVSHVQLQNGEA